MRKANITSQFNSNANEKKGISSDDFVRNTTLPSEHEYFINERLKELDTSKGVSSDSFFSRKSSIDDSNSSSLANDDEGFEDDYQGYPGNFKNKNKFGKKILK